MTSPTHRELAERIKLPEPFGYFCEWSAPVGEPPTQLMYYGEPGNGVDSDWNRHPEVHKNVPVYTSDQLRSAVAAALEQQAVPQGTHVAVIGFRWDDARQEHIPQLLVEFDPVPANSPNDAKGWRDRDAIADWLMRKPTPEASKPAQAEAPSGYAKTVIEALYENGDPVSVDAAELLKTLTAQQAEAPSERELLTLAHKQIRHLIDDLTLTIEDDGHVRYLPVGNLVYSNLIAALIELAPKMNAALATQQAVQGEPAPISRREWIEQAAAFFEAAGDSPGIALEQARWLCNEQDWAGDEVGDPREAAQEDIQGRPRPAYTHPAPAQGGQKL